ncbi:MAG: NUDIX domain-containing protein [Candidatus Dormiibacterota bacterium]
MGETGDLGEDEYRLVYSKVPRLTVDLILRDERGAVFLTRRSSGPCRGLWHLPGGTVRFGEALSDAVGRVAARELSIEVRSMEQRGYIEYPSHYRAGLDSPVGLVFEIADFRGVPTINSEATEGGWFEELPRDMHADQDDFLLQHGYLRSRTAET